MNFLVDLLLEFIFFGCNNVLCIELQSIFPDYQFALGGRLIGIACGSIGLVRKILVCGASGILGNSSFICFFLHCMLKPPRTGSQDSGMRCIRNVGKQSLCLEINL